MGPKKATAAPKKTSSSSTHASYKDMIKVAIVQLKDRMGSSRPAIKKYIQANNNLGNTTDEALSRHVNTAIAAGVKSGDFVQPKGPSGTVKLAKKTADSTKAAAPKTAKAPAKKSTSTTAATKKTAAAPKAAPKKTAAASTTTKKTTTTKAKANDAKPRKAPAKKTATADAPAVAKEKSVPLHKTKSGRVSKSSAPSATKKAAAPKKKTAAATTKKAATPKAKAAA